MTESFACVCHAIPVWMCGCAVPGYILQITPFQDSQTEFPWRQIVFPDWFLFRWIFHRTCPWFECSHISNMWCNQFKSLLSKHPFTVFVRALTVWPFWLVQLIRDPLCWWLTPFLLAVNSHMSWDSHTPGLAGFYSTQPLGTLCTFPPPGRSFVCWEVYGQSLCWASFSFLFMSHSPWGQRCVCSQASAQWIAN